MSGARPTTSPPPHGTVMNAPAHCIRGPSSSPALIVSRSAQSTKARNGPRSRTVVKPASTVTRALRTLRSASWAPEVVRGGDARGLHLADEVAVGVDEPGQDGEAAEVDDRRAVGHAVARGRDRLDARVADEEDAVRGRLAGLDVQQAADADGEGAGRVGEGGGLVIGRS